MKKRKENESLEAIIKRKTRVGTAIVAALYLTLFVIFVVTFLEGGVEILVPTPIAFFSVIGLILCWVAFLSYKVLKKAYESQETFRSNERIVMNKLSRNKYTKVIPKYCTKFSKEFLDDLQNKRNVEFYARLIELRNEETVEVYIKYVTESRYIEYDVYSPGYFLDWYEIVEN